jgi:hypothetical protein
MIPNIQKPKLASELTEHRQNLAVSFYSNNLEVIDPASKVVYRVSNRIPASFSAFVKEAKTESNLGITVFKQTYPNIVPDRTLYGTPTGSIYFASLTGVQVFNGNGFTSYRFTGNQSFTVTDTTIRVDYLLIGGGGGGGNFFGNGGSAGTVVQSTNITLSPGSYSVVVGTGGTGAPNVSNATTATSGTASTLSQGATTLATAAGGAFGINQGGDNSAVGGQGAGGANQGRRGGPGVASAIFNGTSQFYGGGGEGSWYAPGGNSASGVGGISGSDNLGAGQAGVANTGSGGGGGGGSFSGFVGPGGNGTAGVVILRKYW